MSQNEETFTKDPQMKLSYSSLIASVTVGIAITGTHVPVLAETYDGVLTVGSVVSRSGVLQQAVEMARAGNVYGEASKSAPVAASSGGRLTREAVRAEAVVAARLGNVFGEDLFASTGKRYIAMSSLVAERHPRVELGLAHSDDALAK
jgi:hypothetical protein